MSLAARLEDLSVEGGPFDPALLAEQDDQAAFPREACAALDQLGMPAHYVPTGLGGRLRGMEDLQARLREIAAVDLTVAIAHGKTFLGSAPTWVAGTPDQAHDLAKHVIAGEAVAWGLTEPGGGSDLLAGTLSATRTPDGWVLDGQKWPINNATRGRFICVLARTDPAGGPRGFSLFMVDQNSLPPGSVEHLEKLPTHGMRSAEISGISFTNAPVPSEALIGVVGSGVETVLKTLQLTRTGVTALSLGAADHTHRLIRRFLTERRLYSRTLKELPPVRLAAGQILSRFFLAEIVAWTAARAAQALPAEMSVISPVAKALVPSMVQAHLRQSAELLGARGFLTGVEGYGSFAQIERDHQIVPIFDGSTWVNRSALAGLLPLLARQTRPAPPGEPAFGWLRVGEPLPDLDLGRLRLLPRSESMLSGLPNLARTVNGPLALLVNRFEELVTSVRAEIGANRPRAGAPDTASMRLVERYEWCFAGTAVLAFWWANRDQRSSVWWQDDLWLRGCLHLVLENLGQEAEPDWPTFDAIGGLLTSRAQLSLVNERPS